MLDLDISDLMMMVRVDFSLGEYETMPLKVLIFIQQPLFSKKKPKIGIKQDPH